MKGASSETFRVIDSAVNCPELPIVVGRGLPLLCFRGLPQRELSTRLPQIAALRESKSG
jgi:hypothetical protein